MKIVKFEDGTYGIRKFSIFWLGYVYKDLVTFENYWWPRRLNFFKDCKGTLERVKKAYSSFNDKGTPF